MLHRASKNIQKYIFHRWYSVKSKLQTTICPFTIVPCRNRLVHRRYLVKSKLCNVTDLSALYQVGFSHLLGGPVVSPQNSWESQVSKAIASGGMPGAWCLQASVGYWLALPSGSCMGWVRGLANQQCRHQCMEVDGLRCLSDLLRQQCGCRVCGCARCWVNSDLLAQSRPFFFPSNARWRSPGRLKGARQTKGVQSGPRLLNWQSRQMQQLSVHVNFSFTVGGLQVFLSAFF